MSEKIDTYKEELANNPNCDSEITVLETREKMMNLLVNTIELTNQHKVSLEAHINDLKNLSPNIDLVDSQVQSWTEKVKAQDKELSDIKDELNYVENKERLNKPIEVINEDIKEVQPKHEIAELNLEHLVAQKPTYDTHKVTLDHLQFEIEQLDKWYESQKESYEKSFRDSDDEHSQCFKCGLTVVRITEEELHKLQKLLRDKRDGHRHLKGEYDEFVTLHDDAEKVESELYTKLSKFYSERENLETQLRELSVGNEKFEESGRSLKELQQLRDEAVEVNTRFSLELDGLIKLVTKKAQLETLVKEEKSNIETTTAAVSDIQKELDNLPTCDEKISHYKGINHIRKELLAKIDELQNQLGEASVRHGDLLEKNEESDRKKIVHGELKKLKDVFARKGLPKAYVDSRFKVLTELTQKNLEVLETDFFISQSQDKSLAFDYTILYEGDRIELPMHKLSGGQRVRLSLAFILAVQQLVVSELGFVTLDEPSTHLDEEGVDSLCNLLKKVRDVFADSEHQLWVCDHNPKLDAAFGKILKLA